MALPRASSAVRTILVAAVIGAAAGCASDPGIPACRDAGDCVSNGPCERAEGATCDEDGACHYLPKLCDAPPAPSCVSGGVYRVYASAGTCRGDGSCEYEAFDVGCAACATSCAGACDGLACDDLQGGCRRSGHCLPGSAAPTCLYEVAQGREECDDGNLCTYADHCDGAGRCVASAITCVNDPGTCGKRRSCNGTASCTESFPSAATTCDDGNACTYGDHCDGAGACLGTPITCTNDPGPCGLQRTCNGTSTCATRYPTESTSCSDGNLCTRGDHCNGAGQCTGTAYSCPSDSCLGSTCNGTGCNSAPINNGVYCGGGFSCSVCSNGSCVPGCPSGQSCQTVSQGTYHVCQ